MPPSVNQAYTTNQHNRGWHKSVKYKEWTDVCDVHMLTQKRYTIKGDEWLSVRYELQIPLYYKNGKKRKVDTANYEKCLSDYLCKALEGFEDHRIKTIYMTKTDSSRNEVDISIWEE